VSATQIEGIQLKPLIQTFKRLDEWFFAVTIPIKINRRCNRLTNQKRVLAYEPTSSLTLDNSLSSTTLSLYIDQAWSKLIILLPGMTSLFKIQPKNST